LERFLWHITDKSEIPFWLIHQLILLFDSEHFTQYYLDLVNKDKIICESFIIIKIYRQMMLNVSGALLIMVRIGDVSIGTMRTI
jgi:hypothetical protein